MHSETKLLKRRYRLYKRICLKSGLTVKPLKPFAREGQCDDTELGAACKGWIKRKASS